MFDNLDIYTIKARLAPALIVVLPIGMAIGSWIAPGEEWLGLLGTGISSTAMMVLLSQIARGPGKRSEKRLIKEWGGLPSVLMLSYSHSKLSKESLRRYHDRLRELVPDCQMPQSIEEESRDLTKYLGIYQAASDWLRAATRDVKRYRLVFEENVNYGYRRNMLGLKPYGLFTWSIGFLASGIRVISPLLRYGLPAEFSPLAAIYALCCLIVIVIWIAVVRRSWVKVAAYEYAKQLIEAIDQV